MGLNSLPLRFDGQGVTVGYERFGPEIGQQALGVQQRGLCARQVAHTQVGARQRELAKGAARIAKGRATQPFQCRCGRARFERQQPGLELRLDRAVVMSGRFGRY